MIASDWKHHSFAHETLWGVGILICLVAYGTFEYPASVTQGGVNLLLLAGAFLATYVATAMWKQRTHSSDMQSGLVVGALVGVCIGVLEIVNISLETSSLVSRNVSGAAPPTAMVLMAILFGATGSITYQRTSSLKLAVWSGLWCAMVGTVLTCIFGLASSHLALAPILGVFFSCTGAVLPRFLRNAREQKTLLVSLAGVAQLICGVGSIRWALSLAREQRPPFIMFGMLACGLALSYTHPILSAWIRRRSTSA